MRRILGIIIACVAAATLLVVAPGAEEGEDYKVRAIFDNASFVAPGMDVRIAGANVGSVAELDVTFPDEPARLDGSEEPGKAVVVLQIDDAGFQDFRQDASCHIFSQSLLGEKFVECEPTQPRAAGAAAPPELEVIPDGERGEGQRLLPLEQNGKSVDLDLVNNIMSEPYPDRFRLILNDLGAALATRGDELEEIIERVEPGAPRDERGARKPRPPEQGAREPFQGLRRDHDRACRREGAGLVVHQRVDDRRRGDPGRTRRPRGDVRALPGLPAGAALDDDRAARVLGRRNAGVRRTSASEHPPSLERARRSGRSRTRRRWSFTSLGDAAEEAGPLLRDSDPVVRQTRDLAQASKAPTKELALLLSTMRETGGFQGLFETIYGLAGTINAFDSFGHFTRALIPTNVCFDYTSVEQSGCESQVHRPGRRGLGAGDRPRDARAGRDRARGWR